MRQMKPPQVDSLDRFVAKSVSAILSVREKSVYLPNFCMMANGIVFT